MPPLSDAAVAKVNVALALGAMRRCTARAHTGSRPVSSAWVESDETTGNGSKEASGLGGVVAAEPALPVGLDAHAHDLGVRVGQEMRAVQPLLRGQSGLALEHQRLERGTPLRAHEKVGERRVCFVGARIRERHLESRHQFDVEHAIAQVAQLDLPEFNVVFRADPYRGVGLQLGPRPHRSKRGRRGRRSCSVRPGPARGAG